MELQRESAVSHGTCKGGAPQREYPSFAEMLRQMFRQHVSLSESQHARSSQSFACSSDDMLCTFATLHLRDRRNVECNPIVESGAMQALDYSDRDWRVVSAAMTLDQMQEVESLFAVRCNDFLGDAALSFAFSMEVSVAWAVGLISFQNGVRILELSRLDKRDAEQAALKRDLERVVSQSLFALQAAMSNARLREYLGLPFTVLEHNVGHFVAHHVTEHMHFRIALKTLLDCPEYSGEGDSLFVSTLPFLLSLLIERICLATWSCSGDQTVASFTPSFVKYSLFPVLGAAYHKVLSSAPQVETKHESKCDIPAAERVLNITRNALQRFSPHGAQHQLLAPSMREYIRSGMQLFNNANMKVEYQTGFDELFPMV